MLYTYDELDKAYGEIKKKCEDELKWINVIKVALLIGICSAIFIFTILNIERVLVDGMFWTISSLVVVIGLTICICGTVLQAVYFVYDDKLNDKIDMMLDDTIEIRLFDLLCNRIKKHINHIVIEKTRIEISLDNMYTNIELLMHNIFNEIIKYDIINDRDIAIIVNDVYINNYGNYETGNKCKYTLLNSDYIKINWNNVTEKGLYALMIKESEVY